VRVLVIMGATATGKSGLALRLAERLGREIVSADSRQVYRGLRIGTAQPTHEERRRVVHHLVDFLPLDQTWSAQQFAEIALERLRARTESPPLVVGGTGFWLESLMEGLFPLDLPREATLAARAALVHLDTEALHARLSREDAETARRLHSRDRQRILRALEVLDATGTPLSEHHRKARRRPEDIEWVRVRLQLPREELHRRIEARLDAMLDGGWPEEVAALLEGGAEPSCQGLQALGYPEIVALLRGELDRGQARERILARTRQFSRRQEIWFRRETSALQGDPRDKGLLDDLARLLAP